MNTTQKQLREEQIRLEGQMETMLARLDSEKRAGFNTEERTAWDKLCEDHSKLDDKIKAAAAEAESIEKMRGVLAASRQPLNPAGITDLSIEITPELLQRCREPKAIRARRELYAKDPHERAFHNYLVQPGHIISGIGGLSPDEQRLMQRLQVENAQSGGTGTQGGYLIPQGFSDMLEEAMLWFGGIDGVVGEFNTATGNPYPWPTVNDTANKGRIIGQNIQVAETDFNFGQVTFNAYIGSSDLVLIPLALIEDSYFDMDGLTARLLGMRLGRLLNQKGTIGSGAAEPTGIVIAAVAAGNVLQLPAGNTASISFNNLVDLEHSVDPAYRYNPDTRYMFGDTMLKLIKKLVDANNRPLWQPGLTASFREGAAVDITASKPTINDHPYVINQDMAVPAASAYSMLFGDLKTFKVRRVAGGITVIRMVERYADYLQVGFTAFMRFDSNLIDAGTHPVAVLQQSAA